ncbi:phospholipase [Rhizobium leguminosarum bv. trifolii]|uniref:phospholipase D-like domain-containing protein n=1 Tax=Rhizobium leguminosarum TaxID=384 RepID=UPI000E2EDEB1|nr:phospholipase D-like domain-containing protein [Rhizobium leguminosarum]RFB87662.1 phospholipase [Rhizobium leguminosarum bv. trifolii]
MRFLDDTTRQSVQHVIDENAAALRSIPGFVSAEPGFPIVDGRILREPAILVFVSHKKPASHLIREERAPRQLGAFRVAVMQASPERQLMELQDFEPIAESITAASSSELTYELIEGNPIDNPFDVTAPMLCHVGPDAGWPVLKPFLEATRGTLTTAMYDFNAHYIAKTFIDTVREGGIKAVLTWDDSMVPAETVIRKKLRDSLGAQLDGWIVKCGADRRFASAYHEKVAVRDSEVFWLSSGNWSTRSQPEIDPIAKASDARGMYSKGNREWHIIVEDEALSKLFERYIIYDRDGSEAEVAAGEGGVVLSVEDVESLPDVFVPLQSLFPSPELAASVVEPVAPKRLPSSARSVRILPVLTPDNYLPRILELIGGVERSIYLQFSYINYSEAAKDQPFRDMLAMLADLSFKPAIDVRIIVGSADAADKIRKLAENGFNDSVFRTQSSIHNKGIVVDGKIVLISSTNWSSDGVLRNRDAGLIIHDAEIAGYFQDVFLQDWNDRARTTLDDDAPVILATDGAETPPGMVRMAWRDYFG